MKRIQPLIDVYPAIDELITELKLINCTQLADVLNHRMYHVAWTSGSELYDELQNVLTEALQSEDANLPEPFRKRMRQILCVINTSQQEMR